MNENKNVKTEYSKFRKPLMYGLGTVAWTSAVFAAPVAIVVMDRNKNSSDVKGSNQVYTFANKEYSSETEAKAAADNELKPVEVWKADKDSTEYNSEGDAKVAWLEDNPVVAAVGDGSGRDYTQEDLKLASDVASGSVIPAPDGALLGWNSVAIPNTVNDIPQMPSAVGTNDLFDAIAVGQVFLFNTNMTPSINSIVRFSFANYVPASSVKYIIVTKREFKQGNVYLSGYVVVPGDISSLWISLFPNNRDSVGDGSGNTYTQYQIDARDKADQLPKDPKAIVGTNFPERPNTLSNVVVTKEQSKTKVSYNGKTYADKASAYKDLITTK